MTERVIGPTGSRRRKRLAFFVPFLALAALILAIGASAGPVGIASGFEDDDGNLVDNTGTGINAGIDWNSFDPTTWTGTAPLRQSAKSALGWSFNGAEDAQAATSDTAFAGGVKQDDNCATVGTGKAPNKDDLKRFYISSKTGPDGHTYLNLAWVRIPQNTTSPSAHIGFEFNKANAGNCSTGGLAQRVAGDMLIVYDFEGGSGDIPVLTLRRWVTSGACEVGSSSPPCWGPASTLTAGTAEARVNTGATALDTIGPSDETLGINEFGEAGIDLTNAGVFTAGTCNSFGRAYAVSRSSGSSATAAMKDLAGPVNFNLTNCGQIKIIKRTNPRGLNQAFSFSSTIPASSTCVGDATPAAFSLNDNGNTSADSVANTEDCTNVPAGSYTVTEGADPAGFSFGSLSCVASGTGSSGAQNATTPKQADITVAGGGVVTCTYTNNQQLGAIKITKTSTKSGNGLNGATFSITKGGTAITGSPFTTATVGGTAGVICVDNLAFGAYVVTETAAPTGFAIDTTAGQTVTVDNNANCTAATYAGESKGFTDTPLADVQVRFKDGGSGETALDGAATSALTCNNSTGTSNRDDTTGWDDTLTVTGIKVDGVAVITVTCIIKIDP
jgi:hypothetical protein